MIENNNPEIDAEQLMARIREEAARQKRHKLNTHHFSPASNDLSKVRFNIFEIKPYYALSDFLDFQDEEFIYNAYRGVLKREPDLSGLSNFLSRLRSGDYSRIEILGRLRFSPEGRKIRVKIKGLLLPFVVQTAYRLPVLGYPIAWLSLILRLPIIAKNLQYFESRAVNLDTVLGRIQQEVDRLYADKATVDEADELRQQVQQLTEGKASQQNLAAAQQYFQDNLSEIRKQIFDHQRAILDQQRRLGVLLEEARKCLPTSMNAAQLAAFLNEDDHRLDAMYASFEDQFRGTREDIKNRQRIYLPLIQECQAGASTAPVLDVGCGRGEWLELLRDQQLIGRGVEMNRVFVRQCQEEGLDVVAEDAIAYLRSLPDCSLGAITGFHIIEHLPTRSLIALFDEALRVLQPGAIAIFETPNPGNLLVGSCNFYMDPTHRNPLPGPLSRYLIEARGFVRARIIELHPYADSCLLTDGAPQLVETLNQYLYGPQDYAVIAYKAL